MTELEYDKKYAKKKLELKKLKEKYNKLEAENLLLRSFNQPTNQQKIDIIDDYYAWLAQRELDANNYFAFYTYTALLNKNI